MFKVCSKCKKELDVQCFSKRNDRKSGFYSSCKFCCEEWRKKNYKKIKQQKLEYYKKNKEKLKISSRKWHEKNKERIKVIGKKWYEKNKCRKMELYKIWKNNKYKEDILFRLTTILRSRTGKILMGKNKSFATLELLGCSAEEFKQYLERQFKEGMTWENYGRKGWHIDHIKPCASFNLLLEEEQEKCFHYTNLQPLWAEENLKKGKNF